MVDYEITFPPCTYCEEHGWLAHKGEWEVCEVCDGTGSTGAVVPEILTSDGRIARNFTMYPPRKPKPTLRIIK